MRSSHHPVARICATQSREVFQSSMTSWSSKIIAVGTVDSSQRTAGSHHASRYRRQYSSKSEICRPGGTSTSRRARMNSSVAGATSSA